MIKHTPGPWIARYSNRVTRSDDTDGTKSIAHVYDVKHSDQGRANQLLISAAPDLFAAILNSDDAHWTPAMRAALKKAVGET